MRIKLIFPFLLLAGCSVLPVKHELAYRDTLGKCLKTEVISVDTRKKTVITTDTGRFVINKEVTFLPNEYIYVLIFKDGSRKFVQEDVNGNSRSVFVSSHE